MERKVLGKGLAALIPEKVRSDEEARVVNLKVDKIKPSSYQPREDFDSEKLEELITSIKEKGVIQPILVRTSGEDYELIAGERRLRAAKSLSLENVPAIVKDVDDADALGMALIENIQREDLNPIEEAQAYQRLISEFNFTQDRVGKVVGKDNTTVSNSIRLLTLPKKIQNYLISSQLSVGHAKLLLSLSSASTQLELSKKIADKGISVRMLEKMLSKKKSVKRKESIDYDLRAVEEKLKQVLGTKVKITKGRKKGRIEIEYYSDSDLDRIIALIYKEL